MATLNLKNLGEMGAFTGAPIAKEITWIGADEQEYSGTVYVRKLSYHSMVEDIKASANKAELTAGRIAACICDEEGKPIFTVHDITGESDPERGPLDSKLAMALLAAIAEVNGLGKQESPS